MKYSFSNVIGNFIFDSEKKSLELSKGKAKFDSVPEGKLNSVLQLLKDKKYFKDFYEKNLQLTKQGIKEAVNEDQLIIHTISNVIELDKTANLLTKRLREWFSLYLPEFSEYVSNHERFVESVATKSKKEMMKDIGIKETMGADLEKSHVEEINLLAKKIIEVNELRKKHELYLEKIMKKNCPNILELAGVTIGAKLIDLAKGLKRMALLPSSTVQLLGAEKALFRHLKTGSKSPKYGVIINHPLIQDAKRNHKGKAARMLADKLSLCARLDFFKGEMKAKEYRKELEEKLKE